MDTHQINATYFMTHPAGEHRPEDIRAGFMLNLNLEVGAFDFEGVTPAQCQFDTTYSYGLGLNDRGIVTVTSVNREANDASDSILCNHGTCTGVDPQVNDALSNTLPATINEQAATAQKFTLFGPDHPEWACDPTVPIENADGCGSRMGDLRTAAIVGGSFLGLSDGLTQSLAGMIGSRRSGVAIHGHGSFPAHRAKA
jgi:hypothetical protein